MVMDIVKKNLVSILFGVVALICVILLFFPFGGMYSSLTEDVEKGQAVGSSLQSVRTQPRTWPTLSSNEADKIPLERFPTHTTVAAAQKQTENWAFETERFRNYAIELQRNQLNLLVPGSLPGNPGQAAIAFDFMDKYRIAFGLKRNAKGELEQANRALFNSIIIAKTPPTDVEMKAEQDRKEWEIRASMTKKNDRGEVTNGPEVEEAVLKAREQTGLQMRLQTAKTATVYLDPVLVFKPSPKMAGTAAPSPNDIFDAQVGLWIQQELCEAIKQVNAGAKEGVLDAPFKRVLDMKVTSPYTIVPGPPPAEPLQVPQNEATRVAMDYGKNPLGHVSNEFYDVARFEISVICEAGQMPQALTNFTANRYMMCRRVEMTSVDSALAFAQGYLYGRKPVVQLNITGQYLILRSFIAPLMPPDVIRGLTQQPGDQQGQPQPGW